MTRIIVFDSGIGSLPIANSIRNYLPKADLWLIADNGFFPYGEKSDAELKQRIVQVLKSAVSKVKPDCIVIACNTASTIALDEVREVFKLPVIGVVPAIKPAAEATKSAVIGLIATPATINREYTDQLINDYAPECKVLRVGSTELVQMAERFIRNEPIDEEALKSVLIPFKIAAKSESLDQLVLGCTHFPLLKAQIQQILPNIDVIDSSDAIGKQTERIISDIDASETGTASWRLLVTNNTNIESLKDLLSLDSVSLLSLEC